MRIIRHIFLCILIFVTIKKTICIIIHIASMYTHISKFLTIKRNNVNNKTHIFMYTRTCSYKKEQAIF